MSPKNITAALLKRHPEVKELSSKQLRLVKTLIEEAATIASREALNREETDKVFKSMVPDSGKPSAALRAYRNRSELTQMELSKKTGILQPHLAAMESGKRPIGLAVAKKLALALGIDYKKLI
jgi:DNA-binding XRE family transcriptional regulator